MKKFLIVGLGNPGAKYHFTRHNVGFMILDELASGYDETFEPDKLSDTCKIKVKGRQFILIKPTTYMNLSGKAVRYWMQKENIDIENILVLTDDLNLNFGTLRLKAKGSDGGHNGLKHIQEVLGTTKYPRLKFGIGSEYSKGAQVDYVLGVWNEEELSQLKERLEMAAKATISFGLSGMSNTMNNFNGK
jgi:PTH1 family peptidyl-tRNA hydrolase